MDEYLEDVEMISLRNTLSVVSVLFLVGLFFAAGSTETQAERVVIKTVIGSKGQGWLFSDLTSGDGRCWLAIPQHVIIDPETGKPLPVIYTDLTGKSGESGKPVLVSSVPGGLAATGGEEDLAFAPLKFGRQPDACQSGLGLPKLAYVTALRRSSELTLMNLLRTSFRIFNVQVAKAKLDGTTGGLLALRPVRNNDADDYLKAGLSGAVAEITYNGIIYPFAMVLEVRREENLAFGLRFDLIRAAFARLKQANDWKGNDERDKPWNSGNITAFDGEPMAGSARLSSLNQTRGCWTARPRDGRPSVSIVLKTPEKLKVLSGISVIKSNNCEGKSGKLIVEQRSNNSDDWNVAAECSIVEDDGGQAACYMDYIGTRQIKLVFPTHDIISISQIRIY